jgi:hypothetical protein
LVIANGMLPERPESRSCTPSWRAAVSEISTMIASTSTWRRRTSSWRITSDSCRCTSAVAEMTIALAPSKRVTIALRAPTGTCASGLAGSAEAGGAGSGAARRPIVPAEGPLVALLSPGRRRRSPWADGGGSLAAWPSRRWSTGTSCAASAC